MGGRQRTSLFMTSEEEERKLGKALTETGGSSQQQGKQAKGGKK
ncbi:hypothetical protein [Vulcanisaeta distributa]|uniref:Uncharacterized protein n=1 Tax=Vulcanisaeta distributa (strain DSM 14429 / JCM 11212 / NBRC 100878 / IC-017) TaxID=572478 RepID=E1QPK9_VULDI|nr:hypothetical protein [Vulcanisaeta distributa]ADN50305.1 conserved hypothetical protein [Vulcanisaeta distributa DSM 14429]